MVLLAVERYLGDDAETKEKGSKDHLTELMSKIEQRKKIKSISRPTTGNINVLNQSLEISNNVSIDTSPDIRLKPKKKKRKHEVEQSVVVNESTTVNENESVIEEVDHVKHKKHKKKKDLEINNIEERNTNENEDDINQKHLLQTKKHKRKKDLGKDKNINNLTLVDETIVTEDSLLQPGQSAEKKKKRKKENLTESLQEGSNDLFNLPELSKTTHIEEDTEKIDAQPSNFEEYAENNETIDSSNEPESNFTIIGDHSFNKNKEIRRVLPQWLAKPSVISVDLKHLKNDIFSIPHLSKILVKRLQENGITHFFPVQSQLIPYLLKSERTRCMYFWPADVCVSAPTGSGKTLAFVLPIVQTLLRRLVTELRVLVILPVQDLAAQVESVFRKYIKGTGLSVYLTVGGTPIHEEQKRLVKKRDDGTFESLIDILVTTPGRLVDHIYSTQGFNLEHLRFIVIDEADRIMDNFQNDWLYHLDNLLKVKGCPPLTINNLENMPMRPQKLLFSATLSSDPEKLSELGLFQPRLFTSVVGPTKDGDDGNKFIGKYTTPAELKELMVVCEKTVKPLVLFRLIVREQWKHILVFASTTQNVHMLATLLSIFGKKAQHPLKIAEVNAGMPRPKRQQVIDSFSAGQIDMLVSTDSLARGIDIPNVRYVINYDVPKFIKSYIHRVGRTGRAGQDGTAVTLLSHEQVEKFTNLLKIAGKHEHVTEINVDEEELEEFEDMYKESLQSLKEISQQQQRNQQEEKLMSSKMAIGSVKRIKVIAQNMKRLKGNQRKKKGTKNRS